MNKIFILAKEEDKREGIQVKYFANQSKNHYHSNTNYRLNNDFKNYFNNILIYFFLFFTLFLIVSYYTMRQRNCQYLYCS